MDHHPPRRYLLPSRRFSTFFCRPRVFLRITVDSFGLRRRRSRLFSRWPFPPLGKTLTSSLQIGHPLLLRTPTFFAPTNHFQHVFSTKARHPTPPPSLCNHDHLPVPPLLPFSDPLIDDPVDDPLCIASSMREPFYLLEFCQSFLLPSSVARSSLPPWNMHVTIPFLSPIRIYRRSKIFSSV